jgi:hypothetical protein
LLWSGDAGALRGAELFARPGWIGLRRHPGPLATVSYGTRDLPSWIGDWLQEALPPAAGTLIHSRLTKYLSNPPVSRLAGHLEPGRARSRVPVSC